MDSNDRNLSKTDWELTDDYYQNEPGGPELKLEDFMDEEDGQTTVSEKVSQEQMQRFRRIAEDVHCVLALAKDGKTIQEIAAQLNLELKYVYDIQVSAQGFREDDEIAVAHLVEMSL